MPRLSGIEPSQANLFTRLVYWMTKRQIGRVIQPLKVTAHQGRLLWASGQMELAQLKMHSVDHTLKALAEIKVATLIGCPF
jgi:4-carboxymuconolactone decarboxylase